MNAPLASASGDSIHVIESALQRERNARKHAEDLLESKSRELYDANRELLTRISEAEERADEITRAHEQLKQAQSQLVHSEKMASIGQLAAGIAHEINNPLAFITSNLGTLREYAQTLIALVDQYQRAMNTWAATSPDAARAAIAEVHANHPPEETKLLCEDIFATIDESRDGARRVADIVVGLRNFSRVDDVDLAHLDLNEALDATLRIAWNEIKYKCDVVKDYSPLPPITCRGGQVNQVFLNLLVNAAQAIEEHGTITLTTRLHEGFVSVAVADTGKGIAPELVHRIFDPFFTTKEIGKGTGLGLSISHAIIGKHGGRIEVASTPGHGACFTVFLPTDVPSSSTSDSQTVTSAAA